MLLNPTPPGVHKCLPEISRNCKQQQQQHYVNSNCKLTGAIVHTLGEHRQGSYFVVKH